MALLIMAGAYTLILITTQGISAMKFYETAICVTLHQGRSMMKMFRRATCTVILPNIADKLVRFSNLFACCKVGALTLVLLPMVSMVTVQLFP